MTHLGLYFKYIIDKRKVHKLGVDQSTEPTTLFFPWQIRLKFIKDGLEDQQPNADVQISSLSDFISATRDDK